MSKELTFSGTLLEAGMLAIGDTISFLPHFTISKPIIFCHISPSINQSWEAPTIKILNKKSLANGRGFLLSGPKGQTTMCGEEHRQEATTSLATQFYRPMFYKLYANATEASS